MFRRTLLVRFLLCFMLVNHTTFHAWNLPSFLAIQQKVAQSQVGVIEIRGAIDSSSEITEKIRLARRNPMIKALLIKVNSGGGEIGHSSVIFEELLQFKNSKGPIIVFVENLACSGAYWIASAADCIVSSRGAWIGSIGVIFKSSIIRYEEYKADKFSGKIVKTYIIRSGKFKALWELNRALTDDELQHAQNLSKAFYDIFCQSVAQCRNLSLEKKDVWADGRIFTPYDAQKLGLIDKVGSLSDAYNALDNELQERGELTQGVPTFITL